MPTRPVSRATNLSPICGLRRLVRWQNRWQ